MLYAFANDWLGATRPDEPHGPVIFKPSTIRVTGDEYERLRDSHRRHQTDPATERKQVGRFWDLWVLNTNGTLTRRRLP